jgi:hypothetical protein
MEIGPGKETPFVAGRETDRQDLAAILQSFHKKLIRRRWHAQRF